MRAPAVACPVLRRAGARRRAPEELRRGRARGGGLVVLEWSLGTETNKIMFETVRRKRSGGTGGTDTRVLAR